MMTAAVPCELEIIVKFKERLADLDVGFVEDKDAFYMRFLTARNFNLRKAEEMIRTHVQWRQENEMDNISEWTPPTILTANYPYEICGFDHEGHPVLVAPVGIWDVRKICESGMKSDYVRYIDQMFDFVLNAMSQSSEVNGKTITQFILLIVPDYFSAFRQISSPQAVDAVLESVRRFEANYPETLKAAYVIDAPKVFQVIFSVIKPLLNSRTLGKVILASNSREWKPALLEFISADQLPYRLGGHKHSKIPLLNGSRRGNSNDNNASDFDEANGFMKLTVAPGRKTSIYYNVDNSSTELSWAFKTDKYDIGFKILFEGLEAVISYSRLNSHRDVQCGVLRCQRPGKYVIVFDNSFSHWRSKVVRFRAHMSVVEEAPVKINLYEAEDKEPLEPFGLEYLQMETMSL